MGVEGAKTRENPKAKPITKGGEAKPQKATRSYNKKENR
jgi:hypothetical protein